MPTKKKKILYNRIKAVLAERSMTNKGLAEKIQVQRGIDVNNYNQLATDLFSKEGIEDLSEEEIMEPYTIVTPFFSRFSLRHSRAELWDLFCSCIKSDDKDTNKTVLLINYQRLHTYRSAAHSSKPKLKPFKF